MSRIGVDVYGLRELVRDLEKLGVELEDLKEIFGTIAGYAADIAAGFTRKASGALRATVRGNRAKNKSIVLFGRGKVRYAGPQIYGWQKRHILPARTIERTDAELETLAPRLLDEGLTDLMNKYDL